MGANLPHGMLWRPWVFPIPPSSSSTYLLLTAAVVFGPAASTWYRFISSRINFRDIRKTLLARVACDQLVFAPVATGVFLSSMALLEGADPRQKLNERYFTALRTNYLVWPMAQFVNFKFVPVQHQLLFVNVLNLGWNCFLSCLNSGSKETIQHSHVL